MKSLTRDVKKTKDLKRKRENDDTRDDVRIEKQLKCTDFDTNSTNINLDNNVDESAGFFDEYCQILLKDSGANQSQSNVSIEDDLLGDKGQEMFNDMERVQLGVKLKNWAVRHADNLKNEVIDDLLIVLRDEGYLDLPCTAEALLGGTGLPLDTPDIQKVNDDTLNEGLEKVGIWIKKEESCESLWTHDDQENNSSEAPSHDEVEHKAHGEVICPDFAVTSFMNEDNCKNKSSNSLEKSVLSQLNDAQGSKIYTIIKEELQKMEQRWSRQLESTKRSLLYDMVRKYEDLKSRIGLSTRPFGTSFTDDKEILGVKLPFNDVETFCEFDDSIADNPEKEIAMKSLMTTLCFGAASLSNSIGCILSAFLTKDVQMQYSACGKKIRGVKKRNFGDTNTFRYAKDVLREKHGTSDAEIVSKTSRWFTGAGDRDGGRKERRK